MARKAGSPAEGDWLSERTLVPYMLDVPIVLTLIVLFVYPVVYGVYGSFIAGGELSLKNYERLWSDGNFRNSLYVTFLYVVVYTVGIMTTGFVTAMVIDVGEESKMPGVGIFSSLLTLPYAIPDVVGALVWLWMLNPKVGVVNYLLSFLGSGGVQWLTDRHYALLSVIMVEIWRLFPMHTLIILAAFRTVPRSLYEAAELEGATPLQQFIYVTYPGIRNIIRFLLLLTVVWSFKRFTMSWLLTQGGPMHATETMAILIFKEAFMFFNRPYASAIAAILLVMVGVVAALYMSMPGKRGEP
ncbi:MAG: sugar ABC transporter permease [Synergistaceae bacterium]|nr:sugar ABC transporter permease [Synergistaceae bacterium]